MCLLACLNLFTLSTGLRQSVSWWGVWWFLSSLGSKDYQLVTWSRDQTLRMWRIDSQLQRVCGALALETQTVFLQAGFTSPSLHSQSLVWYHRAADTEASCCITFLFSSGTKPSPRRPVMGPPFWACLKSFCGCARLLWYLTLSAEVVWRRWRAVAACIASKMPHPWLQNCISWWFRCQVNVGIVPSSTSPCVYCL